LRISEVAGATAGVGHHALKALKLSGPGHELPRYLAGVYLTLVMRQGHRAASHYERECQGSTQHCQKTIKNEGNPGLSSRHVTSAAASILLL
jgi:hypothetical protein